MFEITLKKGGIEKTFDKEYVNVEDNLLALEHQVRQGKLYSSEEDTYDYKKHRELNESYLEMFVKMYGDKFTIDDLKAADMSTLEVLNDLFVMALGGQNEEDNKESGGEKKEQ